MFTAVVAVSRNLAIGKDNSLPWKIPEDLKHFRALTENHIVIMGRKTFDSLGQKPLPRRKNIVLTRQKIQADDDRLVFTDYENLSRHLETGKTWFVIGGSEVYRFFMPFVSRLYVTWVDQDVREADAFFPSFSEFFLARHSPMHFSDVGRCRFRFLTYDRASGEPQEHAYLDLVRDVLQNGKERKDRTGTGTVGVFGRQLRFDISESIPLLTSKRVSFDCIVKELLWFLKGDTDSKNLEKQGVRIWKENSSREFLDRRGLCDYEEGDIGPMYFFQVYHFNAPYEGCGKDYSGRGFNQMERLLEGLRSDPFSRRHVLTTYNPLSVDESVLAPCHGLVIQFYVEKNDPKPKLSCHMYQRSVDVFLGLPYNIVSYALLTQIIAFQLDMVPNELVISTGDTHIYTNHLGQVRKQLLNPLYPPPRVVLEPSIRSMSLKEIRRGDLELVGYFSNGMIRGTMAV